MFECDVVIRVEMQHFNTGKRRRIGYTKDYEIREEFWDCLVDFVENDELSSRNKHNQNLLLTNKSFKFSDIVKKESESIGEIQFWRDLRYESIGGFLKIERVFVVNTIEKKCKGIDGNYAFFENNFGNTFRALISDSVKDKVKIGALCTIRVLANRKFVVIDVEDEVSDEELFAEMQIVNDLLGGY